MLAVVGSASTQSVRHFALAIVALAAGATSLAACGDDSGGDTAAGGSGGHEVASPVAEGARHVSVRGRSFAFEPDELSVAVDEDVAIVLTSEDSLHDLTIDELDVHVAADRGETTIGGLRADAPGRYAFYCSVRGHREAGMEGVLVVAEG